MTTRTRVVSALLVALTLVGSLAPMASAQQPVPPATQQPPAPPAPATPPPAPDLFQETLKAQREAERHRGVYDAGAVVTNVFLVPGRAITCVLGGAVGIVVLAATLGSGYRAASAAVHEGCGGKWVVTGDDLRPEGPASRPFDWEQR